MSTVADIINAPSEVTFRGKQYPLRDLTVTERAMVSRHLEKRARDAAARAAMDPQLPREVANQMVTQVSHDIAGGVYEWGGAAYVLALSTVYGMGYCLHLALRAEYPEMTHEYAQEMVAELLGDQIMGSVNADLLAGTVADPGNS